MKNHKTIAPLFRNLAKVSISLGLVYWIYRTGRLDIAKLSVLILKPYLSIFAVTSWIIGPCWLGTHRWKAFLESASFKLNPRKALQLQLTGFFFNSTMPGAVGGDLIKVFYVVKENQGKPKTQAFMTVIMDRIIGLAGLFSIGFIATLLFFRTLTQHPVLLSYSIFVSMIMISLFLAFILFLNPQSIGNPWLRRILSKKFPGSSVANKFYQTSSVFFSDSKTLRLTWLLSLAIQTVQFLLFVTIAREITQNAVSIQNLALIFPLGILITALPISPGGLGVGHMAFEKLFSSVGYSGGADVFNLYFISQFALNLLGIIPYLLMRRTSAEELNRYIEAESDALS